MEVLKKVSSEDLLETVDKEIKKASSELNCALKDIKHALGDIKQAQSRQALIIAINKELKQRNQ